MTTRRTIGALMIAALALVGASCGSDSKSDSADAKKTTTTDASGEDSSTTTAKPLSVDRERWYRPLRAQLLDE